MMEGRKPATAFRVLLFAWFLAGMALWNLFVSAPAQPFAIDEPPGIGEGACPHALQGTSHPCCPFPAGRDPRMASLPHLVALPFALAAGSPLAAAIFRLQLVRLHPPVGPPSPFFA